MFDESALWCVDVIRNLRSMGLTVAEIREIAAVYLGRPDEPIGPHIATHLGVARARINVRIEELEQLLHRIDEYEATHAAELGVGRQPGPSASDSRTRSGTA